MEPCKKVSHRPEEPSSEFGGAQWPRNSSRTKNISAQSPNTAEVVSGKGHSLMLDSETSPFNYKCCFFSQVNLFSYFRERGDRIEAPRPLPESPVP